jgi:hypothetical protein
MERVAPFVPLIFFWVKLWIDNEKKSSSQYADLAKLLVNKEF